MKRRDFVKITAATGLGHGLIASSHVFGTNATKELDRFGGWKGKKFKATGFFRLEKDDRWWMVTPEGNAFLSFGINHLHTYWWKQDYNREAWLKILGLDDLDSPGFDPALKAWFLKACRDYGFNTAGTHTDVHIINTPKPEFPYIQRLEFVDIPHFKQNVTDSNFLDIFSDEFAQHCDRMAKELAAPYINDPYLFGYAMTDCPLFTEEDCRMRGDVIGGAPRDSRIGWPRRLRNFGAEAPGKQAYVATMQELYRQNINDFNATYSTHFMSFDDLASAVNWRPLTDLSNVNETRDNIEFLKRAVEKYYKTARDAIRRYDSNHLFFGDKLNANTDTVDVILSTTIKYTDIVYYQLYGRPKLQLAALDRWSKITNKPFLNGDSSYSIVTKDLPRPYGPIADNNQQRVELTKEFFRKMFARPDFIGWHYCGLIEAPNLVDEDDKKMRQHAGLYDGYGKPYPLFKKALNELSEQMYDIAVGNL